MSSHRKSVSTCFKFISTGLFLALPLVAVASDRVGDVEAASHTLNVYPSVSDRQISVTVAGEQLRFQEWVEPGEVFVLSLDERPLADGVYTYEMVTSPPIDQELWEASRNDPELRVAMEQLEQMETRRQVGQFEVVGNEIHLIDDAEQFIGASMRLTNQLREK